MLYNILHNYNNGDMLVYEDNFLLKHELFSQLSKGRRFCINKPVKTGYMQGLSIYRVKKLPVIFINNQKYQSAQYHIYGQCQK